MKHSTIVLVMLLFGIGVSCSNHTEKCETLSMASGALQVIPFTPEIAFTVGRATDLLSEDGHSGGIIADRDVQGMAETIPGVKDYHPDTDVVLWTLSFKPSSIVSEGGCIRIYGSRTKDKDLYVLAIPRRPVDGCVCLQTYDDQ